jgi:hypothetical protein
VNLAAIERRLAKVESETQPALDLTAELNRWKVVLNSIFALDGMTDAASAAVVEHLQHRFDLFTLFAGTPRGEEESKHPDVLLTFAQALPVGLRAPSLTTGLVTGGWADRWLTGLTRGETNLPANLAPATVATIVRVYLEHADLVDPLSQPCPTCGLLVPQHTYPPLSEWRLAPGCKPSDTPLKYDLPKFFNSCPHCSTQRLSNSA